MLDIMLAFDKSQKSHFPELFECKVKKGYEIWFIIWDVTVTSGPFLN